MNKQELAKLFNRIKSHYNTFTTGDEKIEEWYKFLKDYDTNEVNKEFDLYVQRDYETPPLVYSLIRNLKKVKETKNNSWVTCCDICGEYITIYDNDMSDYEAHWRKCSKIDFIDRIVFKYKNKHISKSKYYEMSDNELDQNYHNTMNYYLTHRNSELKILKEIPEEE